MPIFKGTPNELKTLRVRGLLRTLEAYQSALMGKEELSAWRVKELREFCNMTASQLVREGRYFIGLAEYKFEVDEATMEHTYNLDVIYREFKDALATDESDYWGRVFAERMALELVCFFGLDDYFTLELPARPQS